MRLFSEGSGFSASKNLIGTRKQTPHTILIKFLVDNEEYKEEFELDTLDSVLTNINNKILISTAYDENDYIYLKDWIKESEK